ncbi:MAG: hypothetical protein WAU48_01375 [Gammaproteobacteria bacterium]|mgnify:CR=1 FL=1|jgi:hypothetical protein
MRYLITTLAAVLSLAACGKPAEPPEPKIYDPSADVIGAPLHEALDKAGAVEELNADRKNELDASIDAGSTAGE